LSPITINDPNGFDTIYSTDPSSPAAPFVKEYHPRTIEDLYDIGLIPKHISSEHINEAYSASLSSTAKYMNVDDPIVQFLPVAQRRQFIEGRSASIARNNAVSSASRVLRTKFGYQEQEADLIAKKVLTFVRKDATDPIPGFFVVELADDLIIKSPLIFDASIQSLVARNVTIYKTGRLRINAGYFLMRCESLQSNNPWWENIQDVKATQLGRR
jgi:hypothetical protein